MSSLKDFIGELIKAVAKWVDKCLPEYQPSAWNDGNGIQFNNNCYNYGCDIQTGTYAQPGRAHGAQANQMACNKVVPAAAADGLVQVSTEDSCGCSECRHVVALVVSPGSDYHWYRRDKDGKWSHKMAWTAATNLDNSNNIITDPKKADRGSYTDFCGYFCVNKSKVTIS
ncbi:MAG: hypothetical protein OQK71_02100 [Desulfobacter sp.]|nr:hypothetical protein [Desulfobacter sp.]